MTDITFANIIQGYGPLALSALSLVVTSAIALHVQASRHRSGFKGSASAWVKTMYEFGLGEHIGGFMVYRPKTFHIWRRRWYLTVYVVQEARDATRCSDALLISSGIKSRAEAVALALHANFKFTGELTLDDMREHLEEVLFGSVEDMVIMYPLNDHTMIHVETAMAAWMKAIWVTATWVKATWEKASRLVPLAAALRSLSWMPRARKRLGRGVAHSDDP